MTRRIFPLFALILGIAVGLAAQDPPAPPQNPPPAQQQDSEADAPKPRARANRITVPAGTRLPVVLHNGISTRSAKTGDALYMETLFPVTAEDRIVIPAGSYVMGEVVTAKRPGKVKGQGEISIRLNKLILPNGYTVDFNAIPTGADTGGNEAVEEEGKVKGDTDRASDVGTVLRTTSMGTGIGAGVGSIAGRTAKGAGYGTIAGAAGGLLAVMLTRGPEVQLPRGTTLDVMLDRPLYLDPDKAIFNDPGQASPLAGPPNRQPVRQRFPY